MTDARSVLLVEDDEGDALLVRECLVETGIAEDAVIWRRTLADGIAALAQAPGCVLLDLGLPDAEGLGALHRLVGAAAAIPVIVLTGRNDRTGVEAVAAGAQDYLVKDDITPELLDRSIRYAVERSRAQSTELQLREEQMISAENARLERGLLPSPVLRTHRISCATYYQPGRNLAVLGGDFFDVVETPDGRVRAVIGDVMGHGPDEAALGVHLRVAWRTLVLAGVDEDRILTTLSRLLSADSSAGGRFVTACDITIDTHLGVTLRVAGHPPPLVCSGTGAAYLDPEVGPPLGVEGLTGAARRWPDTGGWPLSRTLLSQGDSLILYTDGLLDAYRIPANRQSLGIDELLDATSDVVASNTPISTWIPTIVGHAPVRSADDTAVVVITAGQGRLMATDVVGQAPAAPSADDDASAPSAGRREPRRSFADHYRGWTLRQRVGRWFIALVLLIALAYATVIFAVFRFTRIGDDVIDRWNPAFTVSQLLVGDLVNQETGLRGFGLTGRDEFLQPYTEYLAQQGSHEAMLRRYLAGRSDLLRDLDAFDAEVARWRTTIALPYMAAVRANSPAARAPATLTAGKAEFDRIRVKANTLTVDLRAVREARKADRRSAIWFCVMSLIVAGLLTLGSKAVLWRGLRRSVLEPIEALGVDARTVAGGALDKKIVDTGPPEIAQLGQDVDTMRARLVSELARIDRARVRLLERGEELARSNADLEQFAYVASHDLSEPLRKVANFCQLLERQYGEQLDDKAKQYIAFAVDGAKRMQVLIADLLAFSRVGRTTEGFAQVDTGVALDRALATLDERIGAGEAQIVRGSLPTVPGDATLLNALFQNLVGNALKYRDPDRTPHIEISARRQDEETWCFTVSDNGIGIDRQYAERIFTIFQRLHLRDKYGGTGIGLALCRKIVEFHRGRIWLAENDGPGATFSFTLPAHMDTRDPVDA